MFYFSYIAHIMLMCNTKYKAYQVQYSTEQDMYYTYYKIYSMKLLILYHIPNIFTIKSKKY